VFCSPSLTTVAAESAIWELATLVSPTSKLITLPLGYKSSVGADLPKVLYSPRPEE
jgi:hypothetical protein